MNVTRRVALKTGLGAALSASSRNAASAAIWQGWIQNSWAAVRPNSRPFLPRGACASEPISLSEPLHAAEHVAKKIKCQSVGSNPTPSAHSLMGQVLQQGGKADPAGRQQERSDCRLFPQVGEHALMGELNLLDHGIDCFRRVPRKHKSLPPASP
jgi:hypothetical protein